MLYWFRTPPGVKVGRPALDEEAIRWIEEHNPDIEFDWQKILASQPAEEPKPQRRPRREKVDRRRERPQGGRPAPERARPEPPREVESLPEETGAGIETPAPPGDEQLAQAIEQLTHPEAEEMVEPAALPVEQSIGREQLTRLRARYAELLARITERGGEAERIEALRAQAEALNPDTWVTDEDIRQGVETFEPKIRDLRAALGLRRRRRSRRGGRRRRDTPQSAAGGTGVAEEGGDAGGGGVEAAGDEGDGGADGGDAADGGDDVEGGGGAE